LGDTDVSHLVAEALTNPEIGARRYISRHTPRRTSPTCSGRLV
jgi:hypothetical protein